MSEVLCTAVRTPLQGALNVAEIPARRTRDEHQPQPRLAGKRNQLAADRPERRADLTRRTFASDRHPPDSMQRSPTRAPAPSGDQHTKGPARRRRAPRAVEPGRPVRRLRPARAPAPATGLADASTRSSPKPDLATSSRAPTRGFRPQVCEIQRHRRPPPEPHLRPRAARMNPRRRPRQRENGPPSVADVPRGRRATRLSLSPLCGARQAATRPIPWPERCRSYPSSTASPISIPLPGTPQIAIGP